MRCGDEEVGVCRNSLTRLKSPSWELGEPVCEARSERGKRQAHRLPLPGGSTTEGPLGRVSTGREGKEGEAPVRKGRTKDCWSWLGLFFVCLPWISLPGQEASIIQEDLSGCLRLPLRSQAGEWRTLDSSYSGVYDSDTHALPSTRLAFFYYFTTPFPVKNVDQI